MITIDFNRLDLKSKTKLLDIGCGEGRHIAKASEFNNIFCVGADRSHKDLITSKEKLKLHKEFLEKCLSKEEKQDNGINKNSSSCLGSYSKIKNSSKKNSYQWSLCNADITNLPFNSNSFDIIICSEVLEHIHNDKKALSELKRILKKEGLLAISVPRYWAEKICWKLSKEYSSTEGGHIRIYKKKEIIEKVVSLGFKLQSSHYAHSLHTPFWWLKCFIGLNITNSESSILSIYHKMLVWDIMEKPFITKFLDKMLNPIFGKSLVLYFKLAA